jgi:hypothetical protein
MTRLSRAGFKPEFVRSALLPDWWSEECAADPSLLPDFEVRVATFLRESVERVRSPDQPLRVPVYEGAQLRHSKKVDRDELPAAMLTAQRVAEAAVRNLRRQEDVLPLPSDALNWRQSFLDHSKIPDLENVVADLWNRGIPVLHLEMLPAPKFDGMALIASGRPVIVVGSGQDIPAWLLFIIAHESGHVAHGHCAPDRPVVDATDEQDTSDIEQAADNYAFKLLDGGDAPLAVGGGDPRSLAERADSAEKTYRVDAGHLILAWAWKQRASEAFKIAVQALKALWKKSSGGKATLRRYLDAKVNFEAASDHDRALLSCAFLAPERNEGSH